MAEDEEEIFSDDPEEQLNIENSILKLKLQAELGGNYESEGELPPEIENAFLKNVIEFEHRFAGTTPKTLYDVLERPAFEKAAVLSDTQVEDALLDIEGVMLDKEIVVDYADDYPARLKYVFITEELFLKEMLFFHVPGMTMHYIYEEFHPNHSIDIKSLAERFFNEWTAQTFNEYSTWLAPVLYLTNGSSITKEELLTKFKYIFESYTRFENSSFTIDNVFFEVNERSKGKGFAEGTVSYDAILENGETQHFGDFYKLQMVYDTYWSISYFEWPGFVF